MEIIDEVEKDIKAEKKDNPEFDSEKEIRAIILRLNMALNVTRKIGTIDYKIILRSIDDIHNIGQNNIFREYAITSLHDFIFELM